MKLLIVKLGGSYLVLRSDSDRILASYHGELAFNRAQAFVRGWIHEANMPKFRPGRCI